MVETEAIRENPDQNQIPFFMVDAIVIASYGAHPTACYGYHDYDSFYLNVYRKLVVDDRTFRQYLDQYVIHLGKAVQETPPAKEELSLLRERIDSQGLII